MMTALGNKKNVKIFSFALAGVFIASVGIMAIVSMGDTANAAPTSDIGVVDQRQVISDNGTLALDYQKKLKETADEMQKDFDAKAENMTDAEKRNFCRYAAAVQSETYFYRKRNGGSSNGGG